MTDPVDPLVVGPQHAVSQAACDLVAREPGSDQLVALNKSLALSRQSGENSFRFVDLSRHMRL
jgi:hypothetical protein